MTIEQKLREHVLNKYALQNRATRRKISKNLKLNPKEDFEEWVNKMDRDQLQNLSNKLKLWT